MVFESYIPRSSILDTLLCFYHLSNINVDEFIETLYKNDFAIILGHDQPLYLQQRNLEQVDFSSQKASQYRVGLILFDVTSRRQFAKILSYIQQAEQRKQLFQSGAIIGYKPNQEEFSEEKIIKYQECDKIAKKLGLSYLEINFNLSNEDIQRLTQLTQAIFIINNNTSGQDSLLDSKQLDELNTQLLMSIKKNQQETSYNEQETQQEEIENSLDITTQLLSHSDNNYNKGFDNEKSSEFQHLSHLQVSQTNPLQVQSQTQKEQQLSDESPSQLKEDKNVTASAMHADNKKVTFSAVLENLSNKNETQEIPLTSNTTDNATSHEIQQKNEQQQLKANEEPESQAAQEEHSKGDANPDNQIVESTGSHAYNNEYLFQEKEPKASEPFDAEPVAVQSVPQKDLTLTQQTTLDSSKIMLKQTFSGENDGNNVVDKENIIQYLRTQLFMSHLGGSQLLSNNATSQFASFSPTGGTNTHKTSQQLKYHQNVPLKIKINLTIQSGLQKIGFVIFQLNDNVAKRTAEFCSQYDVTDRKDYEQICELVKCIAIKHGYYTEAYQEHQFASKQDRKPVGCVAQLRLHYGLRNWVYDVIKGDEKNLARKICQDFNLDHDLYEYWALQVINGCQQ